MLKKSSSPRIGKNVQIAPNVEIGQRVVIGENSIIESDVTLRDGVILGKNSYVGRGCILGERLRAYYLNPNKYQAPHCAIGAHAILRAGTIIYGDVKIGSHFETGPYVTIREKAVIGHHSRFGNFSDIQGDCKIGNYVSAHSNVTIGQLSVVQDFVWLHPFTILINDWYPPTCLGMKGPTIGRYSVIGAYSVIYPGVRLGTHVVVGAQSAVRSNVRSYRIVSGNPAKETVDARTLVTEINGKILHPYPWMQHRKIK